MNRVFVLVISLLFASVSVADILIVDDDGKADYDSIQAAVDAASDEDVIIVMPGTYISTQSGHVVNLLGKAVTLRSSDPTNPNVVALTVIDGEGSRRGLACFNDESNSTVINGFTITGCFASQFDYNGDGQIHWWESAGSGMINYQSDPTIQNCSFIGNTATTYAGGMFNYYSDPVLMDCIFQSNSTFTGGGMLNSYSNPILTDCSFINNSADYGGGMYNTGSHPTLVSCDFSNNTAYSGGGGMANYDGSSPWLIACDFGNNIANNGGGMANYDNSSPTLDVCNVEYNNAFAGGGGIANYYDSSPVVNSCEFKSNTAFQYGGGMYNYFHSNPTVGNGSTFKNNTSFDAGGGMRNYRSSPVLTNCSFVDNSAATYAGGIDNQESSSPSLLGCSFVNNTAEIGGGIANYYDSSPTLENCSFSHNASIYGGALFNQSSSSPTLKNCMMIDNTAPLGAGIYSRFTSSVYFDETNVCDALYFSEVGSSIHLAADSVCTVTGSIVPSATGSITFELDDLGTAASLRTDSTFLQQGGLGVRNLSNSLMNAQLGDIIPLATTPASLVDFSSMVFPPLPDGLGLQLIEQVGASGNESELAVEVVRVESTQFTDPVNEDLDSAPIDIINFDADGDGRDEIAVLYNGWPGKVVAYSVSNTGTPAPIEGLFSDVGYNPIDIDTADINGDGYQDLLIANSTFSTLSVLLTNDGGDGSLYFDVLTIEIPGNDGTATCAAVIDWDGNDMLDVVAGIDITELEYKDGYQVVLDVAATVGTGPWLEVPKYQLPDDSYVIDTPTCVDGGDQYEAWGFVGGTRYGRVHRGTSSGGLQDIAVLGGYNTVTIEAIDLDDGGDGQLDLMVSSDEAETVYLFQGDSFEADGFGDMILLAVSQQIDDLIALDSDSDRDMDLMICASESVTPLILLRNDGDSGLLPGGLEGRTWSKQTMNVNYSIHAVTSGGGLSGKDDEDDFDVGIGKHISVRGEVENVMHQSNFNVGVTCEADIDGDGQVNVTELLMVIDQWGQSGSSADINGDGVVDVTDLLMVVANWGSC